jgi:Leucine-rich repeat (LRR) protein
MKTIKKFKSTILSLFIAATLFNCNIQPLTAQTRTQDSLALVSLYNSTLGFYWKYNANWLSSNPITTWYGITVTNNRVTGIVLEYNDMHGTIPVSIGSMDNLKVLKLGGNYSISGGIPDTLGSLSALENLSLYGNPLGGTFPKALCRLTNLKYLSLAGNQLTGSIPAEISNMTNLITIQLNENNLTGSIPPEIGSLPNLVYLNLYKNQLTGSIPPELGNLTLNELNLRGNKLSGAIPPELGNITAQYLYLDYNQLSGSIPGELGNITNLCYLYLINNQFSGTIPAGLGNAIGLRELTISGDSISGTIPAEIGNLSNLIKLYIAGTSITGSIPTMFGNLSGLQVLDLSNNKFTGIPAELNNMSNLETLNLEKNQISSIADGFGTLPKLVILNLSQNQISSIPSSFGNLPVLINLNLSQNQFSGNVPGALFTLVNLAELNLMSNQLSGNIPPEFNNFTKLKTLYLNGNKLSGGITSALSGMSSLTTLSIANNDFTELPKLTFFPNLVTLGITNNKFSYEDIEPNMDIPYFYYDPQQNLGNEIDTVLNLKATYTLMVSAKGSNTTYQWKKNGSNIFGATDSSYTISSATFSDSGTYTCIIFNSPVFLTLYSNPIKIHVEPTPLQTDSLALVELYNSTFGNIWYNNTNWLTGPVSTWYGITVSGGRVTGIDLSDNSLLDSIPSAINNISNLQTLNLSGNKLYYFPDLSSLTNLTELKIENNHLTFESLEPNIGITATVFTFAPQDSLGNRGTASLYFNSNLTLMVTAGGAHNNYQWLKNGVAIPGATQNSFSIDSVALSDAGTYSCDVTNTVVTSLTLHRRNIYISVEYSALQQDSLILIDFYNSTNGAGWTNKTNWLSSKPISTWYGVTLQANRVNMLNLSNNNLSGVIPANLGNLSNLQTLNLSSNQMTGEIPPELGNLTSLANLNLYNNQLGGSVPLEILDISSIQLDNNELTDLPALSSSPNVNSLSLTNNKLTFEDIEPYVGFLKGKYFYYYSQDSVGRKIDTTIYVGDKLILSCVVGGSATIYEWSKNNWFITASNYDSLVISSAKLGDAGVYKCDIYDTIAYQLSLHSRLMRVRVIDTTAPASPLNLNALRGNKQVVLKWRVNSENDFKRYRIYGGTSPNPTTLIDSTFGGKSDTVKTITGLTNSTSYYFRITAVDSSNNQSGYSNEVSAIPFVISTAYSTKLIQLGKVLLDQTRDTIITITNTGTETLIISGIASSNPLFSVSPTTKVVLPGNSFNDTIRFTSTTLGLVSALITISSNASSVIDTINMSGYGYGIGIASYNAKVVDLGKIQLYRTKGTSITITNTGNDTLKITNVSSSNQLFTMSTTPQVILPGNFYNILISYTPNELGSANTQIIVSSNAPGVRDTLSVSGYGYGIPSLYITPNIIWCGNVKIGQSYKTKVTFSNVGNDTLRIDSITFTNPGYVLNNYLPTIPPGKSFSDTVQFVPFSLGKQSTMIIIASNSESLRDTVLASGYGYGEGKLSYNKFIDFGRVLLDHRKDSVIEIANIGNDTFRIQSIAYDNKLRLVPPGKSIKDTISFTPWRLGSESGTILIHSNGYNTVDTIYYQGIGYEFAAFTATPAKLDFGEVQLGAYLEKGLEYRNNGKDTLRITDLISTNEVFFIDKQGINLKLAPTWFYGASVRFSPKGPGEVTGYLIFVSNSPTSPDTVIVKGTGFGDVNIYQTNSDRLMSQNYPNPFNSSTTIAFHVPSKTFVSLKIYNLDGKEVTTLFSGEMSDGIHKLRWDGEEYTAGVYLYRLQIGTYVEVKRLILIK